MLFMLFAIGFASCKKGSKADPAPVSAATGTSGYTLAQTKDIVGGYWEAHSSTTVYYDANNNILNTYIQSFIPNYILISWGDTQGVFISMSDRSSYSTITIYPTIQLHMSAGVTSIDKTVITVGSAYGWTITALSPQSMTLATINDPNKTYSLNNQTYTAAKAISTVVWTKYTP